jgi:dethiobiotin synthetase
VTAQVLFITGTDTGVGKTIATAALAAALAARPSAAGQSAAGQPGGAIAVYKPVQTGVAPEEPGDVDVIRRLTGVLSATEGIRLRRAMAPVAAARREGATLPSVAEHAAAIERLADSHEHVLVEGAGGLLVQLDDAGRTIADLAAGFGDRAAVLVVSRSGLGTLNHTELTLQALQQRRLPIAGVIIGSWPERPDDIDIDNRQYLSALDMPLLGAIAENASRLDPSTFVATAPGMIEI